jgi:TetR/AcrR family transcriptional repressor of nem operon
MLETKDHILKTAFILFLKKGYKSVTMQNLEKETGLTKGAFYHYFKSKEEIFVEVIDKYHLSQRNFTSSEFELRCTLSEFIDYQINEIVLKINNIRKLADIENPDPFFISLILEARKYYPGFTEKTKVLSKAVLMMWENKIKLAQESGEIRSDIDSRIMAETMISIGMSMFKYLMVKETPEFAIDILTRQFVQIYNLIKN